MRTALLALALFAVSAQAQTYRCLTEDGRTVFLDHVCPPRAVGGPVEVKPNVLDYSQRRDYLDGKERKEEGEADGQEAQAAAKPSPPADTPACEEARHGLRMEQRTSFKDPAALRYAQVRVSLLCAMPTAPSAGCDTALGNYKVTLRASGLEAASVALQTAERVCKQTLPPAPTARRSPSPDDPEPKPRRQSDDDTQRRRSGDCSPVPGGMDCPDGFYQSSNPKSHQQSTDKFPHPRSGNCSPVAGGGMDCPDGFYWK